jgi:hypothetical protein
MLTVNKLSIVGKMVLFFVLLDSDVCILAGIYLARTHARLVFLGKWERNDVWD